ncbi:YggT family protein [Lactococcus petauri]|uniref:YggT family protein n=1 Tax=Lactococcus petauri TaxID=1940789 RepID=UPI0022E87527|nr:YggT family protein [Lactococcus petauri]
MIIYILIRLIGLYTWVLVAYALMSWIPILYDTAVGRFIVKISRPYLSLFEGIPLRFAGLDFTIVLGVIALQVIQQLLLRFL